MANVAVIILAAGLGKRMKSSLPKVLTSTARGPMILSVIQSVLPIEADKIVVVTGHKHELVEQCIKDAGHRKIEYAFQPEQKGTGHAVQCALPNLESFHGDVLILYGDTPLISTETLAKLVTSHRDSKATLSVLTLLSDGTTAYGRIVRNNKNEILRIVEAKDCTSEELKIPEVNSGIYFVKAKFLSQAIGKLKNHNAQGEYYLTDIVEIAKTEGQVIHGLALDDAMQLQGVNDLYDLAMVNKFIMEQRIKELLKEGVQFIDPNSVWIEKDVVIDAGVLIGPNVQIKGPTKIGTGTIIEGTAYIDSATIGRNVHIKLGVRIEKAIIKDKASVGPFAHLRPDTVLDEDVKVGNFVEVKKSHLKKGAKASHLTYLGDATVGEDANIGAGTITCNYDGYKKYQTVIGANVFIGSNSSLVAPLKIEEGATVGAGSVITKDVKKDSLALTRAPLFIKEGWSSSKKRNQSG